MKTISSTRAHGGVQSVHEHESSATGTPMTFSVYTPPAKNGRSGPFPVLWYLSGLTCTHANVTEKGEYRAACAEAGIMFIAPDTSPRGEDVPDDDKYDFGKGAGFYVDAVQEPWSGHFRMRTYIEDELPALVSAEFPDADLSRQAITGHSMGGHGALTIGLRHPERFASISAFSPICHPSVVPWGEKALGGYLGEDRAAWREHDAVALTEDMDAATCKTVPPIRVEQGADDPFLSEQLKPELLERVAKDAGLDLALHMRDGYDHSYYFISSFLADHIRWHAGHLG